MANRWIPLESNPEVFNSWAIAAGLVPSQTKFVDIYGLDPDLLSLVPRPVKAIILLFPISEQMRAAKKEQEAKDDQKEKTNVDPTIMWIKQTISNACGTIGILHALINSNVTFVPESPLAKFITECQGKTPEERAKFLETTPLFADIHAKAATTGQTAVPHNLDTNLHFTCFVQAPNVEARQTQTPATSMRLIELDGCRSGPFDRGECKDLLEDVANIVKKEYIPQSTSMEFSMMSLGPAT